MKLGSVLTPFLPFGGGAVIVPDAGWLSTDMMVDTVLQATILVTNSLEELTTIQNGASATMETGSHNGD